LTGAGFSVRIHRPFIGEIRDVSGQLRYPSTTPARVEGRTVLSFSPHFPGGQQVVFRVSLHQKKSREGKQKNVIRPYGQRRA
jgi:hypothetical protein